MSEQVKRELSLENLQEIAEGLLLHVGLVVPVIFLCGREGAEMIEVPGDLLENDETKDHLVEALVEIMKTKELHKIFFVSECWIYGAPEDMTEEQIEDVQQNGTYQEAFERTECLQVIEITRDKTRMMFRSFHRDKEHIELGEKKLPSDVELIRLKPIQEMLLPLE